MKTRLSIIVIAAIAIFAMPSWAQQQEGNLLPTLATDCGGCDCLFNQAMKVSATATEKGVLISIVPIGCKNQATFVTHFCQPKLAPICTPNRNFKIYNKKVLIPCNALRIEDCNGNLQFKKAFGIRNSRGCWANLNSIRTGPGVVKIFDGTHSRLEIKSDVIREALEMCGCPF